MKRFGEYVIVNDIKELTESDVVWAEETAIRINGYGIFRDIDKIDFPHCFRTIEGWDTHSCLSFIPCEKQEVIEYLENIIKRAEENIKEVNKI